MAEYLPIDTETILTGLTYNNSPARMEFLRTTVSAVNQIVSRELCDMSAFTGIFYQPPRENPWLEAVELQDTAYPYHDWNERITAECYAPNAAARVLDSGSQRITRIAKYRIYATDSVVPGFYREWRLEAEKGNPVAQGWLRVLTGVSVRVGTKLA